MLVCFENCVVAGFGASLGGSVQVLAGLATEIVELIAFRDRREFLIPKSLPKCLNRGIQGVRMADALNVDL